MTQPLLPNQFKRIIDLIHPYMSNHNRKIYITPWCASHPNLHGLIEWTGPDRVFAVHVVELFSNHVLVDSKSALDHFLEAVRDDMGEPDRTELQNILDALNINQPIVNIRTDVVARPLPLSSLPFRTPQFTGRKTLLQKLKSELQPSKMIVLCGPGGVGKTALALEAVYGLLDEDQLNQRFPDGVLFHSFYDEKETELALGNLLRQLGEQVQRPLREHTQRILAQRKLLLVLDGAEDAKDLSAVVNIRGNSGILITTRQRQDARGYNKLMYVEPFTDEDAVKLLHRFVDIQHCDAETAKAICQRIGNLPLAIQLIGNYMVEKGLLGQEVLVWLQKTPLEALDQGLYQHESVPILLTRSLECVSDKARQALALIGQLALAPVDHTLLAPAVKQDPSQMPHLLGQLVNLSLLRRESDGRYSVVHALIHTYAAKQMQLTSESLACLGHTYMNFAERQNELGTEGYISLDSERSHLLALAEACADSGIWLVVDQLLQATENYLDVQGYWTHHIHLLELSVKANQEIPNPKREVANLASLGKANRDLGQIPQAIKYHLQGISIAKKIEDNIGEVDHLSHLGLAHSDLGQYEDAIKYHQQGLNLAKEIHHQKGIEINLNRLGTAYRSLGKAEEAIDYYQQALAIARDNNNDRGKNSYLNNLGNAYYILGRVADALIYYQQALIIAQRIGERGNECIQLSNVANLHSELGLLEEAIKYNEQSLNIAKKIGYRIVEGVNLSNIGRVNAILHGSLQAIHLCEQGLAIQRELENRIQEGIAINYLADCYGAMGKWQQTIDFNLQATAIQEKIGDRYQLGHTQTSLGKAYMALDQLDKAETTFKQSLMLAREVGDRGGEAHCQWQRGLLYERQGQVAEAVAAMEVCVDYFVEIGHVEAEERKAKVGKMKDEGRV